MLAGELGPLATARVEWNGGQVQATQVLHRSFIHMEIYQVLREFIALKNICHEQTLMFSKS